MKRVDLTAAAHFRATCTRCNRVSDARTAHTVAVWMAAHEADHKALDKAANGPLLDLGAAR